MTTDRQQRDAAREALKAIGQDFPLIEYDPPAMVTPMMTMAMLIGLAMVGSELMIRRPHPAAAHPGDEEHDDGD